MLRRSNDEMTHMYRCLCSLFLFLARCLFLATFIFFFSFFRSVSHFFFSRQQAGEFRASSRQGDEHQIRTAIRSIINLSSKEQQQIQTTFNFASSVACVCFHLRYYYFLSHIHLISAALHSHRSFPLSLFFRTPTITVPDILRVVAFAAFSHSLKFKLTYRWSYCYYKLIQL